MEIDELFAIFFSHIQIITRQACSKSTSVMGMMSIKGIVTFSLSTLVLAVCLPISLGISTATADSPGFGKKCSHSQFLNNTKAKGKSGNLYQCSGSGISTTKSGESKRYYTWIQIENPRKTSDAKPGEVCFTPQKTVSTKFGKLKCLPVRVVPPVFIWVK